MKNIILSIIILLFISSSGFTQNQTPVMSVGEYNISGELITVKAKGLVCEFCAKALEKVFMRRDDVAGVSVDLTTKDILISLKDGFSMEDEILSQLIVDAGYNIESIKRTSHE